MSWLLIAFFGGKCLADQYTQGYIGNTTIAGNGTGIDANGKLTIEASNIKASFVSLGAAVSNLYVPDENGTMRDIILGYDSASDYADLASVEAFGAISGRYSGPIANNSFLADNVNTTLVSLSDWSLRNWTVFAQTTDSVTFYLSDPAVTGGFPGAVVAWVTYTVTAMQLSIRMAALSLTDSTPLMMSSRIFWNLDGFGNPADGTILNHTLALPYSGQRLSTDTAGIPDGLVAPNNLYSVYDFWSSSSKTIGRNFTSSLLSYDVNATGYAAPLLITRSSGGPYDWRERGPIATLRSKWSGIRLDVFTDQEALYLDTCNADRSLPLKITQRGANISQLPLHGCVGMHLSDWLGAVNQPAWDRNNRQIFGPGDAAYTANAVYTFHPPATTVHCTSTRPFSVSTALVTSRSKTSNGATQPFESPQTLDG